MVGCLWKINEPLQLGATPFRAIKLARGSKFFEAAHALFSCTRKRKERSLHRYGDAHTCETLHAVYARRGFRYSGASAAQKKPKHYRYWWPSCRTDRVDLSARRKEIFLRGARARRKEDGNEDGDKGRRRTAGDTPRRKFTIIFARAGRAAKWNFQRCDLHPVPRSLFSRSRISQSREGDFQKNLALTRLKIVYRVSRNKAWVFSFD